MQFKWLVLAVAAVTSAAMALSLQRAAGEPGARRDLYQCEGCEPTFQYPVTQLKSDVIVATIDKGEPLLLHGVVLEADGRTPAPGVIIFMHQTNAAGLYAHGDDGDEWSRRQGRLRAWAVSDEVGRYRFHTIKPAPYPDMTMPAHVHLSIGEPGRRAYYIDDVVFAGEHKVDDAYRARQELRGGSGIVHLVRDAQGRWVARRDIVLERHP